MVLSLPPAAWRLDFYSARATRDESLMIVHSMGPRAPRYDPHLWHPRNFREIPLVPAGSVFIRISPVEEREDSWVPTAGL